jgi:3-hydroxyisobutyrate dehydrogenase-like beta-hydroxyacid dehydrogenase
MPIGFVGLGNMGFPMVRRLLAAGHDVLVCDKRDDIVEAAVALGATAARSPKGIADQVDTVLASLPSIAASIDVATGSDGVAGAQNGTLAVMVSGPRADFNIVKPVLETIGRPILVSEKPGAAQTMKLVNNMLAATALAATAEAVVMGVKAGLDAQVVIDVLNAGFEEAAALGLSAEITEAVGRVWESVMRDEGPESDLTSVVKSIEAAAGVIVEGTAR